MVLIGARKTSAEDDLRVRRPGVVELRGIVFDLMHLTYYSRNEPYKIQCVYVNLKHSSQETWIQDVFITVGVWISVFSPSQLDHQNTIPSVAGRLYQYLDFG